MVPLDWTKNDCPEPNSALRLASVTFYLIHYQGLYVVMAFRWRYDVDDFTQRMVDGIECSDLYHAHPVFDFGEGLFDWIEVGRIRRQ